MPDAGNSAPGAIPVLHLLAIPNVLVNLLRMQGPAITPRNVLLTVDNFILSSLHPLGPQWDCVCKWCLVAGQSGANRESKIFLETSPVTINDEDFDRWAGLSGYIFWTMPHRHTPGVGGIGGHLGYGLPSLIKKCLP
jgi:hypothetical protein